MFRFRQVLISDVWALMNQPNLSENRTFGFRTYFVPFGLLRLKLNKICPKSELNCSDFWKLGLKNTQTEQLCWKTQPFVLLGPFGRSIFRQKLFSEIWTKTFRFRMPSEYLTVWNWAKSESSENRTTYSGFWHFTVCIMNFRNSITVQLTNCSDIRHN